MGNNDEKKPFYKKWWVWLIAAIVLLVLFNGLGNDNNTQDENTNTANNQVSPGITEDTKPADNANNTENTDNTENADNTENTNQMDETNKVTPTATVTITQAPEETTGVRDNSSAKLTELNTGTFMVGTDIPEGRYVIKGDGSGNLFIYDTAGLPYINEILGGGDFGVETVTTDIEDGDKIEISGINKATFTPAETVLSKGTLTTGNWIVGVDILPGRYDVVSKKGSGNFFVYDTFGIPVVNEILGGGDFGVEKVTVDLKEEYEISISGMNEVTFTKK